MSDTPMPAGQLYSVVSQLPSSGTDRTGRFVSGVDVTITTTAGHTVTVFVPQPDYTVDKVRQLLAAAAANADAIGNLTG